MDMKPEDVRAHLARKATRAQKRGDAITPTNAEVASTARENAILANISASYFLLRRGMAITALAFPIVLWFVAGPSHLQGSISAYYHYAEGTVAYGAGSARNIFVGVLWAIGAFLFFYKGYSTRENLALDVAGIAAVAISLFPMDWPAGAAQTTSGVIHYTSAAIFFVAIAYVSIALSGDTLASLNDPVQKSRFRKTYTTLGILMIAVPAGVLAMNFAFPRDGQSLVTLLIEIAGIYIFSIFWFVKSREIALIEQQ